MLELCAAALFFAGIHLLVSGTSLRESLVEQLGEKAYVGLFSAGSILGLAALIYFYGELRVPQLTRLDSWRPLAAAVTLAAVLLVVFGVTSRGPTAVGGEKQLDLDDAAKGIHRITRHPMLWGFMLWAAVHMLLNPQPPSLIFFGTFLLVAAAGTVSIDAKRRRRFGERWLRYERLTSNLPMAAILQGRNRMVWAELGWIRPVISLAIFAALAMSHARLFGLPAF